LEVAPTRSEWGQTQTLQIGDKAEKFALPSKGSKVSLKKYLGKKNVIVNTYRAFW
jgi:peroxiredoxin